VNPFFQLITLADDKENEDVTTEDDSQEEDIGKTKKNKTV